MIKTDRKHLLQVLINLTSNAIKFTKRDGTITLKANYVDGENKMRYGVRD